MQTIKLYIKDWLAIHPYIQQQTTDRYFVDLANRLYSTCTIREIPESIKKKLCLYTAAYFEDVISGLGLWQAFIKKHLELYDTSLPFYTIRPNYIKDEINEEDIRFIIWNTLEKAPYKHLYINPMDRNIEETAHLFFRILDEEYETLPPMPRYRSSLWISKEKRTQTINYAGCSDILISQNHLYKNILHRLQKPTNSSFHVAPLPCFFMNGLTC